jgi:hypothetical protein
LNGSNDALKKELVSSNWIVKQIFSAGEE